MGLAFAARRVLGGALARLDGRGVVLLVLDDCGVHVERLSALALAKDLERVRRLEPIQARPAGALLKLRRWAQRSPVLATSLASFFLLISTALAFAPLPAACFLPPEVITRGLDAVESFWGARMPPCHRQALRGC